MVDPKRKDPLWVQWDHNVYMKKREDIGTHQPPKDCNSTRTNCIKLRLACNNGTVKIDTTLHQQVITLFLRAIALC